MLDTTISLTLQIKLIQQRMEWCCSSIHSFGKYLLSTCCLPSTLSSTRDTKMNRTENILAWETSSELERHKRQYTCQLGYMLQIRTMERGDGGRQKWWERSLSDTSVRAGLFRAGTRKLRPEEWEAPPCGELEEEHRGRRACAKAWRCKDLKTQRRKGVANGRTRKESS